MKCKSPNNSRTNPNLGRRNFLGTAFATCVITPIAPHNLNVRPIILSNTNEISLTVKGRSLEYLVSLDSRSASIDSSIELKIKKANFTFNLVNLEGQHFFKTLRNKLMWGIDKRN